MPRGGEYDDGPTVASDNPIESGENKIAGAPKGDSEVRLIPFVSETACSKVLIFHRNQSPPASTAPAKRHLYLKALAR